MCVTCHTTPTAFPHLEHCFGCWPTGVAAPPPCYSCGSRTQYFVAGLCHKCHRDGDSGVNSCQDCLAWGAIRRGGWSCIGCRSWKRRYTRLGPCQICARPSHLDDAGACRLCRKQGTFHRQPHESLDLIAANQHGQQLFIADLFGQRDRTLPDESTPKAAPAALPQQPLPTRQLLLFEMDRDLSRRNYSVDGLAERADPAMAAALDEVVGRFSRTFGWSKALSCEVRTGVRILLGFQEDPTEPIRASEVAVLAGTNYPVSHVLDVLAEAGLLLEDRTPTLAAWFARQIEGLPEPMITELQQWFAIMLDGSATTPRRRPRSQITIRLHITWALPAMRTWAGQGHQSLREITPDDVRAVLPGSGNPRSTRGQGLRSVFNVLKTNKVLFTNPISRVKTGSHERRQPLPMNLDLLRTALESPDPARAAIVALAAYHGLISLELRLLKTIDLRDGRLHLQGRTVLLAEPVRIRLATYLTFRNQHWPRSANPHLFLTERSANRTNPPGYRWLKLKVDLAGGPGAVRVDRILDEVNASDGDIRQIMDMFGISATTASHYAASLDNPELVTSPAETKRPRQ